MSRRALSQPSLQKADSLRLPSTELGLDVGACRLCQVHGGAKDWRLDATWSS